MKLTPFQYKVLKIYKSYNTTGLTFGRILRACWRQWALLICCALLVYFFITPVSPVLGGLGMGIFLGAILRDIAQFRIARRMWPVTLGVYDWNKVSELVESYEIDIYGKPLDSTKP